MIEKNFAKNVLAMFSRATAAWEKGNNSGDPAILARTSAECERRRAAGAAKLSPFGIEVDFPGLNPRFSFAGREYHELGECLQAVCAYRGTPVPRGWASV
jgi:hypothetical protein